MGINGIFSDAFWYVAPILVTFTIALAGAINQRFNIHGEGKRLVSWLVGIALSFSAWGLGFISFSEPTWRGIVCLSITIFLASNGLYTIRQIKEFIATWYTKLDKTKELQDK